MKARLPDIVSGSINNSFINLTASEVQTTSGSNVQTAIDELVTKTNSATNFSVTQPLFIKTYTENGNSNVFTLPKTPDVITDIWALSDTSAYYLRSTDYSTSGKDVTILSPTLDETITIKVIYTSKEV